MKDETGRDDDEAGRDETEEENEEFIPAAVKSNEEEERPRSANAEIIRTISRIGTPEIMQQETTLSEKIDETKGSDETSQLATELFGKDFAMFALNTLLMMKPKPSIPVPKVIREKSAIERLAEVLKNKISVKTPITVRVDNVGAIFMAENPAISQRTKHVDVRFKFVNEMVNDQFLEVIFVKTADNDSDIFTKNLSADLQNKHAKKMVGSKEKDKSEE